MYLLFNCCKKNQNEYNKLIINNENLLSIEKYKLFGNDCSICLESLINYECISTINCNHIYHIKCLINYFDYNNKMKYNICCPLCYENQYYLYNKLKNT